MFVYVVGLVYYVIVNVSVCLIEMFLFFCFFAMGVFTLGMFICSCYVVIV